MSSERETLKADFLAANGFGYAQRQPLSGDASTRAYERLHLQGGTMIFMDQPPKAESPACPPDATPAEREALGPNAIYRLAAGRVDAFAACAGHLCALGLSAPVMGPFDADAGLAVMEDLGDSLYASEIASGRADEAELYDAAIDALTALHAAPCPESLDYAGVSWPLLVYDDLALRYAQTLFPDWLPKLRPAFAPDAAALEEWETLWAPIRARGEAKADVFCHRDYHAENLLWLPDRAGAARVGMVDFQDAVRAHRVWDLSMLLHDARRDVSPEREAAALDRYFAAHPHLDRAEATADYHALGALNVARIIGIFARLVVRDGKPRYEDFLPRLWRYLDSCLADPSMAGLKAWFDRHVPAEARA